MICRFDAATHIYTDGDGIVRPHITGMLERTGWIDDRWYTEESCERGTEVHRLTAAYDLGALDARACDSGYKGYLLSHVKAMEMMRPEILEVETASINPEYGFGGRPDRVIRAWGELAILEGKSGGPGRAHDIQTALQAILVAPKFHLPPEAIRRYVIYWTNKGRAKVYEQPDLADFVEARRVIRECCA